MQKSKLYLRKLIVTALMIALYLLLDSVSVDITPTTRLTVSFLTRALVGFLCGPMLGMAAGALSDILGAWIFPRGAYYPGFTITAIVGGLLYGLILYKRKPTLVRSFAAKGAINVVCNLLMNTFWQGKVF